MLRKFQMLTGVAVVALLGAMTAYYLHGHSHDSLLNALCMTLGGGLGLNIDLSKIR